MDALIEKDDLLQDLLPARLAGWSGCERFRFNNHTLTLVAEPTADQALLIRVVSDGTFHLNVIFDGIQRSYEVQTGVNSFRQ